MATISFNYRVHGALMTGNVRAESLDDLNTRVECLKTDDNASNITITFAEKPYQVK